MSEWVTEGIPCFAVVGRINMGKSAVLATLLEVDDDRVIRVSSTPGETTHCQTLPVSFDGREMVRFIDTPGFSRRRTPGVVPAGRANQKSHPSRAWSAARAAGSTTRRGCRVAAPGRARCPGRPP